MNKVKLYNNNIKFNTLKSNNEVKKMEEYIKNMVENLLKRAEREVPDYGDFKTVFEEFKNPDKSLCVSDFLLKIVKPPKNIDGHEKLRNLELVAYKLPSPYMAEKILASGSKNEIIKQLNSTDIMNIIKEAAESLAYNLSDM